MNFFFGVKKQISFFNLASYFYPQKKKFLASYTHNSSEGDGFVFTCRGKITGIE